VHLRNNLSLKITALFLAIFAWVYVHNLGDTLTVIQVPVDLNGIPAEFEITGDHPTDMSVHLRGPAPTLNNLRTQDVSLNTNLSNHPLQPGGNSIAISESMIQVPAGVTVDRYSPTSISFTLEPTANKEVPVEAAVYGTPAEGYERTSTTVVPARIVIEGPESAVEAVDRITTTRLSIANATDTRRAEVTPIAAGPSGSQVRLAHPDTPVEVIVRIQPIQGERNIAGIRLMPTGVAAAADSDEQLQPQLEPATVSVRVMGPRQQVNALMAEQLVALVDLTGQTGQNLELAATDLTVRAATLDAPRLDDLIFEVVEPATVTVTWTGDEAS
jgi:YbbR domain-containing protein